MTTATTQTEYFSHFLYVLKYFLKPDSRDFNKTETQLLSLKKCDAKKSQGKGNVTCQFNGKNRLMTERVQIQYFRFRCDIN